ncbi:MAG TPA: ABC transporter permease [Sedimentisphaerales bacterium]|nr:ABC transporter permease [Sedimentisphaerales bacterium]
MHKSGTENPQVTVIKPQSGWQVINFRELSEYKDLFLFLVWRDIKILYAQTILGFAWATLNPLLQIIIFTFVFGRVARVQTDGIPYVLFSTVAIIPWTYMSEAMIQSSQSLVQGQQMLGKVYFPRLLFPITPVLARLVDFGISILILLLVVVYYRVVPTWNLMLFPLFFVSMVGISAGVGMWLSAMAIRFRDVKFAMQFIVRMLMYSAPIVYSASSIPKTYRVIYSVNPIVGVIEGLRSCLLGRPVPWEYVWPGMVTALLVLITGALYFKRMERIFVDVI